MPGEPRIRKKEEDIRNAQESQSPRVENMIVGPDPTGGWGSMMIWKKSTRPGRLPTCSGRDCIKAKWFKKIKNPWIFYFFISLFSFLIHI
jgi:hypothetical protein